jgi:hypothetical protein
MEFLVNVFGNKDVVGSILKYCTPYINLAYCGPDSKEFQSVMKRDIERKLELYGSRRIIIPRLCEKFQLMGSELLQILYGETWENSDVDIITTKTKIIKNRLTSVIPEDRDAKSLNQIEWINKDGYTTDDLHDIDEEKMKHSDYYERVTPYRMYILYNKYKNVTYNTIKVTESENIQNLVVEHYDLDICKILYDGKTVFIPHWKEILNKHSVNLVCENRVYKITPNDVYYRNGLEKLCNLTNRIAKYIKRGFQIDVDYVELVYSDVMFEQINMAIHEEQENMHPLAFRTINEAHVLNNKYIVHHKEVDVSEIQKVGIKQVTRLAVRR